MEAELEAWTKRFRQIEHKLQTALKLNCSPKSGGSKEKFIEYRVEAALLRRKVDRALRDCLFQVKQSKKSNFHAPLALPGNHTVLTGIADISQFMNPYRRLSA